jgi:hypothetical protein
MATELRITFPKADLTQLAAEPEAWAKETYEIATKIAYQNGRLRGTPKGQRRECREVADAAVLPPGYMIMAKRIADRRITFAGYRLADIIAHITRS